MSEQWTMAKSGVSFDVDDVRIRQEAAGPIAKRQALAKRLFALPLYEKAALEFVGKVERREARSASTYHALKAALVAGGLTSDEPLSEEESLRRLHVELHSAYDHLLACFLTANRGKTLNGTTLMELIEWSAQQTKDTP
jgi:hypothetical protein